MLVAVNLLVNWIGLEEPLLLDSAQGAAIVDDDALRIVDNHLLLKHRGPGLLQTGENVPRLHSTQFGRRHGEARPSEWGRRSGVIIKHRDLGRWVTCAWTAVI